MAGFLNPEGLLKDIGILEPGMKVGDFGCGAGYFSVALAKNIGDEGRVYAVDILESALETVKRRALQAGITNIDYIRANLEDVGSTGIPNGALQLVLLATILFQADKKEHILQESKRVLQKSGFLVIIDWDPQAPIGPGSYKVPKQDVIAMAQQTGFILEREFSVDSYHYGLLFKN